MQNLIITLWAFHGLLAIVDEFKFHRDRGLGRWERIGHPVDSIFFIAPFIYTHFFENTTVFLVMCALSCVIVTKDEFIHNHECNSTEQWLHSVLFIMHPISLYGLWYFWQNNQMIFITMQTSIIFVFMLYQIIYWNIFQGQNNEATSK